MWEADFGGEAVGEGIARVSWPASRTKTTQFTVAIVESSAVPPDRPVLVTLPRSDSGELVRPRPARDSGSILIRPYVGGVVEQRDEG